MILLARDWLPSLTLSKTMTSWITFMLKLRQTQIQEKSFVQSNSLIFILISTTKKVQQTNATSLFVVETMVQNFLKLKVQPKQVNGVTTIVMFQREHWKICLTSLPTTKTPSKLLLSPGPETTLHTMFGITLMKKYISILSTLLILSTNLLEKTRKSKSTQQWATMIPGLSTFKISQNQIQTTP